MLIGGPGTGKTHVATIAFDRFGWVQHEFDPTERQLDVVEMRCVKPMPGHRIDSDAVLVCDRQHARLVCLARKFET